MSLAALQCALADLFTDPHARIAYSRDADAFARRYLLNARDRAQLNALAQNAVASYAKTLVRKRRGEALRLLPETRAALGAGFAPAFDRWALRHRLPEGSRRYARDAIGFCRHTLRLRKALTPAARASVKTDLRNLRPQLSEIFRVW